MASRFEPVTDPDKAWEYRQAGVLYWRPNRHSEWNTADLASFDQKEAYGEFVKSRIYQYAILVEDDAESTQCEGA